ncbi:CamS family sex pheromone protein [Thalassobacillus hwangdonensis]|uniref:CamS family sex pheromone protein n=1 Tax=Thalassobacillus hwangdonensis TaxID=546108 RepID=A0ABW3L4V2_9BACI
MRKIHAIWLVSLLLLSACIPAYDNHEEIVQDANDTDQQTAIVPRYNIAEDDYKMILTEDGPKVGKARGVITRQVFNRLDIGELETGLLRHSKEYFDPDDYYFQAGQFLNSDLVYSWLERKSKDTEEGLNPEVKDESSEDELRDNPKFLSHVLEQNFLRKNKEGAVEVAGVSLGLALKSTYQFQTEIGGPTYYEDISEEEMLQKGKQYADQILQRVRQIDGMQDMPIMIALYREEDSGSMVPGNFVSQTYVKGGSMSIKEWKDIPEKHVLFPSSEARNDHFEDYKLMEEFRNEITSYFPDFTGFIGDGFYVEDQLRSIKIDIPIQFNSETEVIGFTQYVYGLVVEMFDNYYNVEVNIMSDKTPESVIIRKAGDEEPTVHVY